MFFDELQVGIKYYLRDRVRDGRGRRGRSRRQSSYTETRSCHFCGKPGHLVMSCREKKINDEMGNEALEAKTNGAEAKTNEALEAKTNDNGEDELLAMILNGTADPLPVSHGDTVRWQGVATVA